MYVVQLLLPLYDNQNVPIADAVMKDLRERLVDRFGGVTAFSRTPAEGVWSDHGRKIRDDVILVEVMVPAIDSIWWAGFREHIEHVMRQKSVVVRALPATRL